VYKCQSEKFVACTVVEFDLYGGGAVMVWASICLNCRTDLYDFRQGRKTALRYHDVILELTVRPFAAAVADIIICIQEYSQPRTVRVSMNFLAEEGIDVMDWPARSLYLKIIEY